jgi:hypothetical protein
MSRRRVIASVSAVSLALLFLVGSARVGAMVAQPLIGDCAVVGSCWTLTFTPVGNGQAYVDTFTDGTFVVKDNKINCEISGQVIYGKCSATFPKSSIVYWYAAASLGGTYLCEPENCSGSLVAHREQLTFTDYSTLSQPWAILTDPVLVKVTKSGAGTGRVTSGSFYRGIDCGPNCSAYFPRYASACTNGYCEPISLLAEPDAGSVVGCWSTQVEPNCHIANPWSFDIGAAGENRDDVSVSFDLASPPPTATPTPKPTATPTAKPTATPTAKPTATPTAKPTATPTAKPTATPTTTPAGQTPTPHPTTTPVGQTPSPQPTGPAGQTPTPQPTTPAGTTPTPTSGGPPGSSASPPTQVGGGLPTTVATTPAPGSGTSTAPGSSPAEPGTSAGGQPGSASSTTPGGPTSPVAIGGVASAGPTESGAPTGALETFAPDTGIGLALILGVSIVLAAVSIGIGLAIGMRRRSDRSAPP